MSLALSEVCGNPYFITEKEKDCVNGIIASPLPPLRLVEYKQELIYPIVEKDDSPDRKGLDFSHFPQNPDAKLRDLAWFTSI